MTKIGWSFFLPIFVMTNAMKAISKNINIGVLLNEMENEPFASEIGNKTSLKRIIPAEKISAIATGRMPFKAPWTNLFLITFFRTIEIRSMMMKAGKTTAIVAIAPPRKLPNAPIY